MTNIKIFVSVITRVAKRAGFSNPKKAFWNCSKYSDVIAIVGKEYGIDVEIWTCSLRFKQTVYNVKEGDKGGHDYIKIGDTFYDFTIRQFDINNVFPFVSKKPHPKSIKLDITNLSINNYRDPDMLKWHKDIKYELTKQIKEKTVAL